MKALIFDLDGTLVDSVYAHVLAWRLTELLIRLTVPRTHEYSDATGSRGGNIAHQEVL